VVLIEASEESGSPDLPAHVEALLPRIGLPSLVVCLDSGCPAYDRLWATTSLRGLVGFTVSVGVLGQGVHSGAAGGVVPSSMRILRALLERIEDAMSGQLLLPELHVEVPADRRAELAATAAELGPSAGGVHPFLAGVRPHHEGDPGAQMLANTWEPALAYVGVDGLALSFRLPPTCDSAAALAALQTALSAEVPHGAHVTIEGVHAADGWNAPTFSPWLRDAMQTASQAAFGRPAMAFGEGGTIPFMGMLGERFPEAQLLVTGVLGPESNAHGPNEFLHVPYATKLTEAVAHVLQAHAAR